MSDENVQATNPNYNSGCAFQMNCQRCVPAYEMRMRGYDVVAKPVPDVNRTDFLQINWEQFFENPVVESGFEGTGKAGVVTLMEKWGDGARGEVYIDWANQTTAHVFVAENRSGKIYFLDPQTGELDVEYYFDEATEGLIKLLRIDNLEINKKYIIDCCEESK